MSFHFSVSFKALSWIFKVFYCRGLLPPGCFFYWLALCQLETNSHPLRGGYLSWEMPPEDSVVGRQACWVFS